MSSSAALKNDVFMAYLAIVGSLLLLAGLGIGVARFIMRKPAHGIERTYLGWAIMAPVVFLTVFLGREAVIVGVALLSLGAVKEFARATGLYRHWALTGAVYVFVVLLAAVSLVEDPRRDALGWYGLYMAMPVYAICCFVAIPIVRNRARGQLQQIALAVLAFIYLGWMFGHLGMLANSTNPYGYLLYILVAVQVNDVSAFIFGKMFGRRKLLSEISPNKTIAGALGALGVSLVLPWAMWFSFPEFGAGMLILTGLVVGVGGQFGDLTISFFKRDLQIKDMGVLIPGHGGLLDRIDSIVYVAPVYFHLTRWFFG